MKSDREDSGLTSEAAFSQQIAAKAARKLRRQHEGGTGVWYGLGMTGLIGWSVVLPTVLGALLGLWLDGRHPGGRSWTLALLMGGLFIGCANAWHWVAREDKVMHAPPQHDDESGDE